MNLHFNRIYSRSNLPKIKDGAYVINLDGYKLIETRWIALYANDNFGVEHIPKEIKKFIGNKNIITSICRTQRCDSIMHEYFCIGYTDFMLKSKNLLHYTNFFPNKIQKMIKKVFGIMCNKYTENLKTLKYHAFSKKKYFFLLIVVSMVKKMKRYLNKKNQLIY